MRIAAAMLALSLAACAQPEDRINAAMPVGTAIDQARAALLATAGSFGGDATALEGEYARRLQRRGRECGHGYAPGPFSGQAAIRDALGDRECFRAHDRDLRQWLELRRVGLLLAAPPLRPLPTGAPAALAAGSPIRRAEFAERAGIALLKTGIGYRTFDLANGHGLHQGGDGTDAQGLSANGRVFLTAMGKTLQMRGAQDGALLADLAQVPAANFHWLGTQGAIFHRDTDGPGRPAGLVFVDFASGRETRLAAMATRIERVAPVVGASNRYALVSLSRVSELELRKDAHGATAVLLGERVLPTAAFAGRDVAITQDGRHLVGVEGSLQVLDLDTLRARSVPLTPFRPESVVLTAQPDVLWLEGRFPDAGMRPERYLYAAQAQTLARVDDTQLPSTQVVYAASLHRNAVIVAEALTWVDPIPHAPPVAAYALLDERAAMAFALVREQALHMPQIARSRLERSRALDAQARGLPTAPVNGVSATASRP